MLTSNEKKGGNVNVKRDFQYIIAMSTKMLDPKSPGQYTPGEPLNKDQEEILRLCHEELLDVQTIRMLTFFKDYGIHYMVGKLDLMIQNVSLNPDIDILEKIDHDWLNVLKRLLMRLDREPED